MEVKAKVAIWIRHNNCHVYGDGRQKLLELVDKYKSLSRAAREMGIAYRAAWGKIKTSESALGRKLLTTQVGGRKGGGSELTDYAREISLKYKLFRDQVKQFAEERFVEIFLSS